MQQHCDHLVFFNLVYSPWSQNGNKPNFFLCNRSHNCTSLTISFVGPSFWLKRRFWLTKPASLNLLSILLKQARTKQLILLYYTIWSASQEWLRFYSIVSGVRNAATNHAIWYRRLAEGSYWALCGCSETIHTPAVVPMRLKPTFCCSQHEVATRRTVNAHALRDHYVQSFFIVLFGGSNLCRLQSALSWPRSRDYYQVRKIVVRNKSEPKKGETRSFVPLLNKPRTRNSKAAAVSRVRLESGSRLTRSRAVWRWAHWLCPSHGPSLLSLEDGQCPLKTMKLSLTSGHTPRLFRSRSQVGYEASCFWNMASEMFYAGACLLEQGCGLVVHTLLLLLSSLSSRPVFVFFWVSSTVSVARACGNSVASRKPVAPRNGRVLPHLSSRRHELPSSPLSHCFRCCSPLS